MSENPSEGSLFCANHPDRETALRCNRCNKPICTQCAVLTPTGYRCKECLRGQQKIFETANWSDYPIAAVIAAVLSFLGSLVVGYVGFFSLLLAPLVGFIISEVVRRAVKKRRSRRLFQVAAAGAALGSILPIIPILIYAVGALVYGQALNTLGIWLPLLWRGLYIFLVTSTTYYRLSGIQLNR